MVSVFESHIDLLERQTESRFDSTALEQHQAMEDVVQLHTAIYEVMERHLGTGGLSETHRPLVPLFKRWLSGARRIVAAAGQLKAAVEGLDDLIRAMNRSKPMAEHFDYVVALNLRTERGMADIHQPLVEVIRELRSGSDADR